MRLPCRVADPSVLRALADVSIGRPCRRVHTVKTYRTAAKVTGSIGNSCNHGLVRGLGERSSDYVFRTGLELLKLLLLGIAV